MLKHTCKTCQHEVIVKHPLTTCKCYNCGVKGFAVINVEYVADDTDNQVCPKCNINKPDYGFTLCHKCLNGGK